MSSTTIMTNPWLAPMSTTQPIARTIETAESTSMALRGDFIPPLYQTGETSHPAFTAARPTE